MFARPAPHRLVIFALLAAFTAGPAAAPVAGQSSAPTAEEAAAERDRLAERIAEHQDRAAAAQQEDDPPAHAYYMGREVAQTMHWRGAEWLTRNTRQRQENTALLIETLDLEPGMVVCDLGAGNGYYTLKISDALAERGTVIAQDIQPEMLELLQERAELHEAHDNILYTLGTLTDPLLPPESCDLILLVDAYHEFSHPEHMLRGIRDALKPDGQLVLVEFRAEDDTVPIKPEHKMSKDQMERELEANGFSVAQEFDELPWQHVMFFERDEDWEPVAPGTRFPEELETADPPRPARE